MQEKKVISKCWQRVLFAPSDEEKEPSQPA
jgi:hypothetical protein